MNRNGFASNSRLEEIEIRNQIAEEEDEEEENRKK